MRRLVVGAVVLTVLGLGGVSVRGEDSPREISFDKDRDAFATPNRAGNARESRTGTCNGDVELEFAWAEARKKDASLPPLAQVEQEILARAGPTGGEAYLLKIRELAQRHSYRAGGGGVRIDAPEGRARSAEDTLAAAKAAVDRGEPTRLLLSGTQREIDRNGQVVERKVFHTVTAYQTAEAGGTVGLRVADSSAPGHSGMLIIDAKTGGRRGWDELTDGDLGRVRWDRVDRITNPPGDPGIYRRLLDAARQGIPARRIESDLNLDRVPPPTTSAVISDPKAGGVWIAFDPSAYGEDVSEAAIDEWISRTQAFLDGEGGAGLALSVGGTVRQARLVSLRRLLAEGSSTLGDLTRVEGYVLAADGDVWLAGRVEEGRERIPIDLMTVALRTVWQRGSAPFVSLDPDPKDFTGPPKPRHGGLPNDLAETAFVRILFAADYAMKEIVLGARPLDVDGYRSLMDLLVERKPTTSDVFARLWLTPVSAPVADVMETRSDGGTAVWFQSRVLVLTEQMLMGAGGLVGTGRADPLWGEAAALFTSHYEAIAEQMPVFRRLQVVFDLAKACAIWRARGVSSPVLDALAARTPASGEAAPEDEPQAPFSGVGLLPVDGTDLVLSGGARAKARVRPQGVVTTDRLIPLLDAVASGAEQPVEIVFPAVMDLDAAALGGAEAELSFTAALALMRGGEWSKAVTSLSRVIAVDPSDPDAYMLRGLAHLSAGSDDEGRADLDRAAEIDLKYAAVRALVRVTAGEREAGLRDAGEAERAAPEDEQTLVVAALARIRGLDFVGAQADIGRLRALAPGHPALSFVRNELSLWRALPRERAEVRLRQVRELPLDVQRALVEGANLIEPDAAGAIAVLERGLALAEASPVAAVRALSVPERFRFLIGLAAWKGLPTQPEQYRQDYLDEAAQPAREQASALVAAHPSWPSGYVLRASVEAAVGSEADALASFALAADRRREPDGIFDDMAPQWGTSSMVAMLGTSIVWGLWERGLDAGPALERCASMLGDMPTARAFSILVRHPEFNLARFLDARSSGGGGDEATRRATLGVLREIEEALSDAPAHDAIAQWFLQVFEKAYLPLEQEVGEDNRRLLSSSLHFLRATEGVEVRPMFTEPIYGLRAAAYGMAAAAVVGGATEDMRTAFESVGGALDGALQSQDAGAVRAGLKALTEAIRRELPLLRGRIAARCDDVLTSAGPRARDAVLLQVAAFEANMRGRMGSARELERLEAIPGVPGSAELVAYQAATEEAKRAGLFVTEEPATVLARLLAAPKGAVEGETLLRFLPMVEQMTQALFPDGQAPVDFAEAQRILKVRIRLAAYAAPGQNPGRSPIPASEGGASPSDKPLPILLLLVGALILLGAVLLLLRPRRR